MQHRPSAYAESGPASLGSAGEARVSFPVVRPRPLATGSEIETSGIATGKRLTTLVASAWAMVWAKRCVGEEPRLPRVTVPGVARVLIRQQSALAARED
jgi:hypothetical protein